MPTPKSKNNPEWTEGRYRAFISSALRSAFRKWPPKFKVLKSAFVGKQENPATGRIAAFYKCAKCKKDFVLKNVQVDHKDPVVDPKEGFVDWDTYIDRMLVPEKKLQVLCTSCHKKKTDKERKTRNEQQSKDSE